MSKTVFCRKYKQDLPSLMRPPYPGPKGQAIFDHVSEKAWQAWLKHQTLLINEKQLSMMDPEARKYLAEQMEKFFDGEEVDQADGYVPPES